MSETSSSGNLSLQRLGLADKSADHDPRPETRPQERAADTVVQRPRVTWIAGPHTFNRYAETLMPLAAGLAGESFDLVLLLPQEVSDAGVADWPGEVVRYSRPRWSRRRTWQGAVAERLRPIGPALLHALDVSVAALAGNLATVLELPYVVGSFSRSDCRRLRRCSLPAAGVLAADQVVSGRLLKRHVTPAERVHVVRPGVQQVERASCFSNPNRSLAIVAGCEMKKLPRLAAMLRSFAELRRRNSDCVFTVVGTGPAEPAVRKLARKLGLDRDLILAPQLSSGQMAGIVAAADIYVSPEATGSVDMSSLLAMASGTPVLAGHQSGDFIIPGQTAAVYKATSAAELTAKLTEMVGERDAARSLAEGALAYLRRHHSTAGMVSTVAQIYRDVISSA